MWKALITGVSLGLYLAISVGPILFTVIKQSLNNGIRGGFSFVAGIWLSDILFVLISNVFSVFTAHFANVYIKEIGYGGGLLLLGLGCFYVFFKSAALPSDDDEDDELSHAEMAKLFGTGFLINTLNPILFFEWLSAATVFAKSYSVNYRILIFSACLSVNILSDVFKVTLADKIKSRLTEHNLHVVNIVTGSILILCGGFLLYQTFFHSDKWRKKEEGAGIERQYLLKPGKPVYCFTPVRSYKNSLTL